MNTLSMHRFLAGFSHRGRMRPQPTKLSISLRSSQARLTRLRQEAASEDRREVDRAGRGAIGHQGFVGGRLSRAQEALRALPGCLNRPGEGSGCGGGRAFGRVLVAGIQTELASFFDHGDAGHYLPGNDKRPTGHLGGGGGNLACYLADD